MALPVNALWLFLTVPWVGLQRMSVVFSCIYLLLDIFTLLYNSSAKETKREALVLFRCLIVTA